MSFNIALTGLNAVTEQLNAVSNNIANTGTTGFKSSRTEFGSVYADTQAMGVEVLGNTQSISLGGALVNTGRTLDLAISGGGFFVVKGTSGETQYTRAGVFGTDAANYIVNAAGQKLQGYPTDADGNLLTGSLGDLRIKASTLPAKATDSLEFVANLDANETEPGTWDTTVVPNVFTPLAFDVTNPNSYNSTYTTKVYDSLGKEHTLTQYFARTTNPNEWRAHYFVDGQPAGSEPLEFDGNGALTAPAAAVDIAVPNAAIPGATPGQIIAIDYTGTSQYGTDFGVSTNLASGYTSGEQTGVGIDSKGNVFVNYSNGQSQQQGQVVLASFINPEGLKNVSGTAWTSTIDSGAALIGTAGVAQFGKINAGTLENSNVDLTEELVTLMQGQRNYQANTKVISTQKDLDQILFSAM